MLQFDTPVPALPCRDKSVSIEQIVKRYEPLMYKIGLSFGFNDSTLHEWVRESSTCAIRCFTAHTDNLSIRLWMAKRIVQKCILKISLPIFQQEGPCCHEMPVSFRAVYVLNRLAGFDENEMAFILNTTPLVIRERLNKALSMINRHEWAIV